MHTICDPCPLYEEMIELLIMQNGYLVEVARWNALVATAVCLMFGVQLWRVLTTAKNQRRFW